MPHDALPQESEVASANRRDLQLRVVFDTNTLINETASHLVSREVATLLKETARRNLHVLWYLPDVVRQEREYQMRRKATALHLLVKTIEQLLDPSLNISKEVFLERVEQVIEQERQALRLMSLSLDTAKVDWLRVIQDAVDRKPPFQEGNTEKGFRDALIAETFLQLVADSPKEADVCRLVLVTNDKRLASAVNSRLSGLSNTSVLSGIHELKGLINTIASGVNQALILRLQSKAARLFSAPSAYETLYYTQHIHQRIKDTFRAELADTEYTTHGEWSIREPTFLKKEAGRVFWSSRLDIPIKLFSALPSDFNPNVPMTLGALMNGLARGETWVPVVRTGLDSYEVIWSTEVMIPEHLEHGQIEDMKHIGVTWEPAASCQGD